MRKLRNNNKNFFLFKSMKLGVDLEQLHTASFKVINLAERHFVKFDGFHFPPSEQYRDAIPLNKLQESIVAVVWQKNCP